MKKYITILSSLLLVSVLVFSNTVSAATIGNFSISISGSALYQNSYNVDYDLDSTDVNIPHGDINIATYRMTATVYVSVPTDSYINGYQYVTCVFTPTTPSGWTLRGYNCNFTPTSTSNFFTNMNSYDGSGNRPIVGAFFDNYYTGNQTTIPCGVIEFYVSYSNTATPSNLPDPPSNVSVSGYCGGPWGSTTANPNPSDEGLVAIIRDGIINALSDVNSPFEDLLTYIQNTNSILTDIYNHNEQWYSSIVDELLENNQWNSTITDYLIALYQELSLNTTTTINIASYTADLRSFMQTFPTWSAKMLQLLGKLADMSAAEQTEAAAIASQYDSLQQQQDDANAVVKAVPRPTFSASQFDSSNMVDTTQRQNFTGLLSLIVGNGYITRIFIIVVTFATAGFILFGKKK